jgi:hypothetical protein
MRAAEVAAKARAFVEALTRALNPFEAETQPPSRTTAQLE